MAVSSTSLNLPPIQPPASWPGNSAGGNRLLPPQGAGSSGALNPQASVQTTPLTGGSVSWPQMQLIPQPSDVWRPTAFPTVGNPVTSPLRASYSGPSIPDYPNLPGYPNFQIPGGTSLPVTGNFRPAAPFGSPSFQNAFRLPSTPAFPMQQPLWPGIPLSSSGQGSPGWQFIPASLTSNPARFPRLPGSQGPAQSLQTGSPWEQQTASPQPESGLPVEPTPEITAPESPEDFSQPATPTQQRTNHPAVNKTPGKAVASESAEAGDEAARIADGLRDVVYQGLSNHPEILDELHALNIGEKLQNGEETAKQLRGSLQDILKLVPDRFERKAEWAMRQRVPLEYRPLFERFMDWIRVPAEPEAASKPKSLPRRVWDWFWKRHDQRQQEKEFGFDFEPERKHWHLPFSRKKHEEVQIDPFELMA